MKNKKKTYLLLSFVILIWGAVLYQFFSFSDGPEATAAVPDTFSVKPLHLKAKDTFGIDVRYRDPFLGKMYVEHTTETKKQSTVKPTRIKKTEEPVNWPEISYKGIVSDTKDKVRIYMLMIAGKTCLMKKGETQEEVFLKDGNKDHIYVKYKGQLNIVLLQE